MAYQCQERWNQNGYEGLKPRFAGGCASNLYDEKKRN